MLTHPRTFQIIFWLTLAIRAVLAWRVPLTGDEAYYVTWGLSPRLGFYDHPPMVGWLLAPLVQLSLNPLWVRLPAVAAFHGIAWLVGVRWRKPLPALLLLLAPAHLLFFVITPDIPLLVFGWLAIAFWDRTRDAALPGAQSGGRVTQALAAGFFLGLALLSKYFALGLGLGVAASLVLPARWGALRRRDTLIVLVAAVPAGLFHLWWNSETCWVNWVFNTQLRVSGAAGRPISERFTQLAVALGSILALAAPALWALRGAWRQSLGERPHLWLAAVLPLLLLTLGSWSQPPSFHYFMPFVLPLYLAAVWGAAERPLRQALWAEIVVSALLALGALVISADPPRWFPEKGVQRRVTWFTEASSLVTQLREREKALGGEWSWASDGYTSSAMIEAASGRRVLVLDWPSPWGRQDDYRSDLRKLEGRDMLIFSQHDTGPERWAGYFREVTRDRLLLREHVFFVFTARGFRFTDYYEKVMKSQRAQGWVLGCCASLK